MTLLLLPTWLLSKASVRILIGHWNVWPQWYRKGRVNTRLYYNLVNLANVTCFGFTMAVAFLVHKLSLTFSVKSQAWWQNRWQHSRMKFVANRNTIWQQIFFGQKNKNCDTYLLNKDKAKTLSISSFKIYSIHLNVSTVPGSLTCLDAVLGDIFYSL